MKTLHVKSSPTVLRQQPHMYIRKTFKNTAEAQDIKDTLKLGMEVFESSSLLREWMSSKSIPVFKGQQPIRMLAKSNETRLNIKQVLLRISHGLFS